MIAAAIDIGLTGAVGFVDSRGTCTVHDLPTLPDGKAGSKRRLDGRALGQLLRDHIPAGEACIVVFEDVRPRPNPSRGTSIVTEGALMRSRGVVEGVLDCLRLTAHAKVVQPQTWKRHFGLIGKQKYESRLTALALYPCAQHALQRKKDHNRAEALLIAHWGLQEHA